jgi:hypothetical protein
VLSCYVTRHCVGDINAAGDGILDAVVVLRQNGVLIASKTLYTSLGDFPAYDWGSACLIFQPPVMRRSISRSRFTPSPRDSHCVIVTHTEPFSHLDVLSVRVVGTNLVGLPRATYAVTRVHVDATHPVLNSLAHVYPDDNNGAELSDMTPQSTVVTTHSLHQRPLPGIHSRREHRVD